MSDLNNGSNLLAEKENALKNKIIFLNEDLGKETVLELTEVYIESTGDILAKLNASFDAGNFTEIRNLVHSLRGNSGSFGFEELVAACKELEISISEGKTENVTELLKRIIDEIKVDVDLLKRFVKKERR